MIAELGPGLVALVASGVMAWSLASRAEALRARDLARAELRARGEAHGATEAARVEALRDLGRAREELRATREQAAVAAAEGVALRARLDEARGVEEARGRALDALRAEAAALAERARGLEAALAEARAAREGEVSKLEARLQEHQAALRRVEVERRRLAREVEDLHERLGEREARLAEAAGLAEALERSRAELERLRAEAPRGASAALSARLQELNERAQALEALARSEGQRADRAEQALARGGAEAALQAERDALRARVDELEASAERLSATRAALRALGLPEPGPDAAPLTLERRGRSQGVLRDTYLAASASAAGLFDARGVAFARVGNLPALERLAASAVLLSACPADAALGRPAQLLSERYGVHGRHLARLGDAGLVLGLTASRACPALALRLASLRLVGVGAPEGPPPEAAPLDLDPRASDRLGAWALRRDALSAAVLGAGRDPAATDSAFAGACLALVEPTLALHRRALRDGFGASYSLEWRGADDVTLCASVMEPGGPVAFALFSAPPPERVIDDLAASARWLDVELARAS